MPKLYNFQRSGNCYKVRLMASLLGIAYDRVDFDPPSNEHKSPEYLILNPMGQVPTWAEDDGTIICDSHAILVYLTRKYGNEAWLPTDAKGEAEVIRWLSFTAFEIMNGIATPRAIKIIGRPGNFDDHQAIGLKAMATLDAHLANQPYLAAPHVTIADVAAFSYITVCGDAEINIKDFPNVQAWTRRIEALDRYQNFHA